MDLAQWIISNNFDIVCIQEWYIHKNKFNITCNFHEFMNYNVYHPNNKTLIIHKENMKTIEFKQKSTNTDIRSAWLGFKINNKSNNSAKQDIMIVGNIYHSPN